MNSQKLEPQKIETRSRPKIFVEGHGCSASFGDTEILAGLISASNYDLVEDESQADLSVLVTCSVKTVTEQRMLHRIDELRTNVSKVVVAGCLAKSEPGKILSLDRNLSLLGPGNLHDIIPAIESTLHQKQFISIENSKIVKLGLPRTRRNEYIGIVEIGSGCLSSCTFCQVKLVKGNIFSYPEDLIVDEVRTLVTHGTPEIWLTSTDNSAYGKDSRTTLAKLIRRVCSIPGDFRVRIGMMNPLFVRERSALEDLVDAFSHEKVFKFLHLPVQSGSERILKLMRRGYTDSDYLSTIEAFRSRIPKITLSTDIIVGFPDETENDFDASLELVKESRPDVLNLSRYGARDGTIAAKMDGQVPESVSKNRSTRMNREWKLLALERNLAWKGYEGVALVDEHVKGALVARNNFYKPVVLRSPDLETKALLGKYVQLRVTDATSYTLHGQLLE